MKQTTDFRYNTGASKVPWPAVGENYNVKDATEVVKFLMKGEGKKYDKIMGKISKNLNDLDKITNPPGKLSLGSEVEKAEDTVNKFLGVDNATFVMNCTSGFEIAYKYANIKPGDEVIVPAITFIATMAYPLAHGAKLVFADVDPKTLNMDPNDVEKKITAKTKMIVPVHIGGYPVDMDPIMKIAKKHKILVLEDAAHAFGAKYKGKMVGTIGDFGSYSFHEVKNITSFGEGGIVTTSIKKFGPELKRARFFGLDFTKPIKNWLYNVTAIEGKEKKFVAANYSTTEIQALGLRLQTERVKQIIAERKRAVKIVNDILKGHKGIIPQSMGNRDYVPTFHLYQLQIDPKICGGDVQVLKAKLEKKGVTNIPHFGPLYRFQVVKDMGYDPEKIAKTCPVCEEVFYKRFTHLPIYGLTDEQLVYMANAIIESVEEMKKGI
ncbi:MAG: DegT/DnrJ/EryC1/StrS family aminotransferase [Clostridia bacterium]|nr:DegT/DnrJ/EryC1/StrS family aminotransferase [Clostridia bacterium]